MITDAVIPALLKLVSNNADDKNSLTDEFALALEEVGVYLSLYKERRFGYSAGSIYDAIPQFMKLLKMTSSCMRM